MLARQSTERRKRTTTLLIGVAVVVLIVLGLIFALGVRVFDFPFATNRNINEYCATLGLPNDDSRSTPESIFADADIEEPAEGITLGKRLTADGITSRYNIYARNIDFSKPVGVVVRLHGDGGEEFYKPDELAACLAEVAASHNKILVVPLSPDSDGERTWWEDIPSSTTFLGALLDDVAKKHKFNRHDVHWTGYSGGAEVLSYGLIPQFPSLIGNGALMLGGGGASRHMETVATEKQKQTIKLTWATGMNDDGTDPNSTFDAKSAAEKGARWYRDEGFANVSLNLIRDADHFTLPEQALLDEFLTK
ncbi:hypothetical protein [Corynebacterium sp. H78]|uniref:hypothetical protein n=1 Tax=Corynebacterium sp. H78 TaxID=3133417 RepID=UPI0030AB33B9